MEKGENMYNDSKQVMSDEARAALTRSLRGILGRRYKQSEGSRLKDEYYNKVQEILHSDNNAKDEIADDSNEA